MIVSGEDKAAIARFVANQIPGCERGWENYQALGVWRDGELVGGIVYHNWSPESAVIELSVGATTPHWMSRRVLRELFAYPFDFLDCRMIAMRVSEYNTHMRSILKRLGCKEYAIDDLRSEGEAEVVCTLTRAAWREFIGEPDGQVLRANAA